LSLVPPGAQAELDAATAHRVDLRHRDRERAGLAERHRRHERTEPEARGVAREPGEGHPGVGRAREPGAAEEAGVVVGTEEGVEAERFGALRERALLVVRRALLGLDEDAEAHGPCSTAHAPTLPRWGCGTGWSCSPTRSATGCCRS